VKTSLTPGTLYEILGRLKPRKRGINEKKYLYPNDEKEKKRK